ncbi:MAG: class I SAM-dependent methyltransferase [Bacteroidia bacterium]|nr:class I SAM-dependent methyltransferase [Bacteroidia bacterium]
MALKFSTKIIIVFSLLLFLHSHFILGQNERKRWQPPEQIMDSIGVKPGMIIGEAGAGRGFFTFYLAKRVGEKGKVYANDILKSSLDEIQSRSKRENITNIITVLGETEDPLFPLKSLDMIIMVYVLHEMEKPVLGETEDPLFPLKSLDMIIMVYVLHEMEKPVEFMGNLQKYIKPETQLVIIEKKTNTNRSHYPPFMTKKQISDMMEKTNYRLERIETFLRKDNIYIYKLKD